MQHMMSSDAKKTKYCSPFHTKLLMLRAFIFKINIISKCLSLRQAHSGFNKSLPTENMRSTAAEDGREVLYFKKCC